MGIGTKPASLASIPTVKQRGPIAPAPVYDLTKKNVKYPDFDACAQAQKFDTYGCSPCPEPQEPTYVPVDEQHYGASFPAPGRVWAEAGQGPASRVDCDGKEVGESRLVFPTYKKGATTRTAGYSYDRTLLETRQPARCSYGYAMPYYGCAYGYGCGYQQPSYACGGKTVDARGYGECKECEDYPRGMAHPDCYNTCDTSYDEEEYVQQGESAYKRVDFPAPEYSYDVDASVAVPRTIYDLIGTKPVSLASIPTVQQRGPIAPAPVYDLTKKNVKYPDFDACAQAQKFDTYGYSPCPEPQEPT